jgi:hypothetical protein
MVAIFVITVARVHNLHFCKMLRDAVQTVGTGRGMTLCVCVRVSVSLTYLQKCHARSLLCLCTFP